MFSLQGAKICAQYAFAPNYYHYCGPDTSGSFGEYVKASAADGKLAEYLSKFETLYPYLVSIAQANNIQDPLDPRVVEAYWVGNVLLNKVKPQDTYSALTDGQKLHKRLDTQSVRWLLPKIDQSARLHHSFHVFNVFTRTGHHTVQHTVATMDQCRIGWGKVTSDTNIVSTQELVYNEGKLEFNPSLKTIVNPIQDIVLHEGDWVSFHWGFVCQKLTTIQVQWLERLTLYHLKLANETL